MILDRYDEETYTLPLWKGNFIYHEDILFFRNRKSARLLYPIDRIISVRSYDLQTEFTEGTDYTVKDGELYITENSAIPVWDIEPFTSKPDSHVFLLPSKPSQIGFVLDETLITKSIVESIVNLLCDERKRFIRVCFIGTDKKVQQMYCGALKDKSCFAFSFINDLEKAKEWLVSE